MIFSILLDRVLVQLIKFSLKLMNDILHTGSFGNGYSRKKIVNCHSPEELDIGQWWIQQKGQKWWIQQFFFSDKGSF